MSNSLSKCSELMCLVRVSAKQMGIEAPINHLTLGMFKTDGKAPKFKLKAAEARRMVKFVFYMLANFFPSQNAHDELRLQCVKHLHEMYMELECWNDDSPPKVVASGRRHCLLYAELTKTVEQENASRNWCRWKLYPKHHLFLHCLEDQVLQSGNPRDNWCYLDEGSIGHAVKIAESAHVTTLHRVVIQKHRLCFC